MKIVTWNINGVRARIGNLTHWLTESAPDIVCLQEIKTVDDQFPRAEIEALGYNVETNGQKSFNGVAILSTRSIAVCRATMPTTTRVSSKASSRPTKAPCASLRSTCRTAIRSTTSGSFPTSCHGWRGWSAGLKNGSGSRKRWCWPATTMSSPNRPTPGSPRTGGTTRCSSRRPGKPSAV